MGMLRNSYNSYICQSGFIGSLFSVKEENALCVSLLSETSKSTYDAVEFIRESEGLFARDWPCTDDGVWRACSGSILG